MGIWDAITTVPSYDDAHSTLDKLPKDPAGTPFIQGSDNPLDILTGKTTIGPDKASTANLDAQRARANTLQDQLTAERAGYAGNFDPRMDSRLAGRQEQNIGDLVAAAAGRVASPAELQLQRQAGLNAARQFGLASALQGRNPGAALRSARLGSLATQSDANLQAAQIRAQDQQNARAALVQALASARTGGQNLLQSDIDWRKALLGGQLGALDSGEKAAAAQFEAENKNAAAQNQFNGGILQSIVGAVSDRTAKKDIESRDMTKLAGALKGYRFKYKDPKNGEGERVGIMAQDAAKGGPEGRKLLLRTPDGKLGLDMANSIGAALAMSAQALRETRKAA